MNNALHYLLMSDHLLVQKQLFVQIKDLNLSLGQPKVLDYLIENDGAVQKEIAGACHIEPASLSSILDGMEKKGLVSRSVSKNNRRSTEVYLTEHGRKVYERISLEFKKIESQALAGFSSEEAAALLNSLLRISKNLEDIKS